eukprot:467778-Pelagomonas_calceolata.AAC.3
MRHVGNWYAERPREQLEDMASRMTLFNLTKRVDILYSQYITAEWKPRALQNEKQFMQERKKERKERKKTKVTHWNDPGSPLLHKAGKREFLRGGQLSMR